MKYLALILTSWIVAACGSDCVQRGGHIKYGTPSGYYAPVSEPDGTVDAQWIDTTPAYCVGAKKKK